MLAQKKMPDGEKEELSLVTSPQNCYVLFTKLTK